MSDQKSHPAADATDEKTLTSDELDGVSGGCASGQHISIGISTTPTFDDESPKENIGIG